ncbi:hypothetical protein AX16_010752 [Volvariella volvacea WC 439]|nr:hypothetical protein AX16_010752 [Volvariella volvacea WC 439]
MKGSRCAVNTRDLRALAVRIHQPSDINLLERFLIFVAHSLDSFSIDAGSLPRTRPINRKPPTVDLSVLHRLTCLTFSTLTSENPDHFSFVLHTLASASTPLRIKTVNIIFYILAFINAPFSFEWYKERIAELDDILGEAKFDELQDVHLTFYICENHMKELRRMCDGGGIPMPKTRQRKKVYIHMSDEIWRTSIGPDFPRASPIPCAIR